MPNTILGSPDRLSPSQAVEIVRDGDLAGLSNYVMTLAIGQEASGNTDVQPSNADVRTLEMSLTSDFDDIISDMEVEQVAISTPGRPRRGLGSLGAFRFMPLRGRGSPSESILGWSGSVSTPDPSVDITYRSHKSVYLDAWCSIGLVKDNWLIAIASAGIDANGALKIVQIQDVTAVKRNDPDYFRTGLHDGFLWRHTLVRAWEQMAIELGISRVIVQGYRNNVWTPISGNPAVGKANYDNVAESLGYDALPNGDWVRRLMKADN